MKFRMFTGIVSGGKIAVNVDRVLKIVDCGDSCAIEMDDARGLRVAESFDVVFSRLNTVAD